MSEVTLLVDRVALHMETAPSEWYTVGEIADELDENTLRVRNVLDGNPERFHKGPLASRAGYQYRLQAPPPERTHNRLPSEAVRRTHNRLPSEAVKRTHNRLPSDAVRRTHNRIPSDAFITEVEFHDGTTIVPGGWRVEVDGGEAVHGGAVLTVELVDNGAGEVVRISIPNAPEWIDIPTHQARLIKWERR